MRALPAGVSRRLHRHAAFRPRLDCRRRDAGAGALRQAQHPDRVAFPALAVGGPGGSDSRSTPRRSRGGVRSGTSSESRKRLGRVKAVTPASMLAAGVFASFAMGGGALSAEQTTQVDAAALDAWWDFQRPDVSESRFRAELVRLAPGSPAALELK